MEGTEVTTSIERDLNDLVSEVSGRIQWNIKVYGKAWNGEDDDTRFIVGPLLDEIKRLRDAQ